MKRSGAEEVALAAALGLMMLTPIAEAVLRKTFHTGIASSAAVVQHLTLFIGMMGGALAARENRLLALSALGDSLKGSLKTGARIFSNACAAAIVALLCVASLQFVAVEKTTGHIFAYGIPLWWIQSIIPLGMGLIALRLLRHSATTWSGRIVAAVLAAAFISVCILVPEASQRLSIPALLLLGFATLLGAPAFVTLGGAAMILFWRMGLPIASIPIDQYGLTINPSLPTMPLFTVAGYLLAEGGAPKRLIRVFGALLGGMPGGAAVVAACACAFFTSFTGGSGVTILALGGLLMPVLLAERYSERDALGLITSAGSLGLLFPPCLPLILYAIVAKVELETIFLAGMGPGILLLAATAAWGVLRGRHAKAPKRGFDLAEARAALWEAKWELFLPVVALASMFGGFATPVEAAALTALYALVVETVIYRDLKFTRDVPRVMAECGLLVGGVLLILGMALAFTNYLVAAEITSKAVDWTTTSIHSRWVFLLALNLYLLIVGCLMDIYSAIVVQVPLLIPMGLAFGVDPAHLGIIFLANLELGYLTPPVGLNLFLSSYRFNKPISEVVRAVLPVAFVLAAGVLLITYVPALTTALPRWLSR